MYTLVLLAGGSGSRMKKNIPKQFLLLAGKPMIMHTLERMEKIKEIEEIIIVCKDEYIPTLEKYRRDYCLTKKISYAPAGATRQESAYNGLSLVKSKNVIIHEAARPFVHASEFQKLIDDKNKNAIYAYPINFTVLKAQNNEVNGLLERDELINVQLPQKFETKKLLAAHEKAINDGKTFTDDSSLFYYYMKEKIATLDGTAYNLKITETIDLIIGEIIYQENKFRKD